MMYMYTYERQVRVLIMRFLETISLKVFVGIFFLYLGCTARKKRPVEITIRCSR